MNSTYIYVAHDAAHNIYGDKIHDWTLNYFSFI